MNYQTLLSETIKKAPRSFIRDILKTAISPDVISFAGGLPNHHLFPVDAFQRSANRAIEKHQSFMFQYSNSEGYLPLRQWICNRYKKLNGWHIDPKNILITNGSQQGLDLMSKITINSNDAVLIEEPGYLGAIQSLSVQGAKIVSVPIESDGANIELFKQQIYNHRPKLFYTVPAFQNPTGISYSSHKVKQIANHVELFNMLIIEDAPYRELSFDGAELPSFYNHLPNQTVLLGSFSKTTVPGLRLGWMVAPDELMERLIVAKQAADLHTDIFGQLVLYQYLCDEDYDAHISKIRAVYSHQCHAMANAVRSYFPASVRFTQPLGGMFLWLDMPNRISAMQLFNLAIEQKVAFVPGLPFYADGRTHTSSMRLNFSCSNEKTIDEGMRRLGAILSEMMKDEMMSE